MPVDGTYGRLSSHNHRMKDLRRRLKDKGGHKFLNPLKVSKVEFTPIDPDRLLEIKLEIQRKRKIEDKKNIIALIVSIIVGIAITFFFLNLLAL